MFLFLSWLAWLREQRLGDAGRISEQSVYLFTTIFTLACFIFFAFAPLPRAYYPEFVFHRPEEFLPALFFLAALAGYLRKGEWRHDSFEHWLVLSLIVGFVGQAVFMSFSGSLFDMEFDVAHTLKKVSYVCVLTGLLANMYAAFRLEAERVEENNLRNRIAVAANQSSNTEGKFSYCLKQICRFMGWNVGHVYVPLEDGSGRLQSSGCWYSSDDERFRVFRDASFDMICEDGLIGRVFKSATPDWAASVTQDPNFKRAAAAAETGLQGSVAFPVGIRDEIVAVFEFYSLDPIEAVQYQYDILEHAGSQMGRVVERSRLERELVDHRDHLQERVTLATKELKLQAEELADALNKEKELNELQRQFVSMASHEFRTPLAIIDGAAQRLKRRIDKGQLTPEDTIQRIEGIRSAVRRMTRLMESTLTAARLQDGKIAIEICPCDIGKEVREVCSRQQDIVHTHIISCVLMDLPESIMADRGSVEQVLANLLSNAVKYSPESQTIDVKAWEEGRQVVISVRDYGLGIDQEDLPDIGERFFRAKTSTGIAGTGIGLNLAKTLVEMHGGTLHAESVKGEGSCFTFRLPVAGPDQSEQATARVA